MIINLTPRLSAAASLVKGGGIIADIGTDHGSVMVNSEAFSERTVTVSKSTSASGNITKILFGTMGYTDDFSGVCGLFKGDCVYIRSIEFIV